MTRRQFTLTLAAPAVLRSQSSQERGKRLVDEALEALGGKAFLAMQDRVEAGRGYSFFRERLSGLTLFKIYTRYTSNGLRERQAYGKKEDYYFLFAEGQGHEVTFRGARPVTDLALARYRDSSAHNFLNILRLRLKEPGLVFEAKGKEIWENRPVESVDIIDSDNQVTTVYLHLTTKLPMRQFYFRRNVFTKERDEEVTLFSKYRDVGGGVQWPLDIQRERNGDKVFQIYSDSVQINLGLRDDLFTLPGNIKILPKEK